MSAEISIDLFCSILHSIAWIDINKSFVRLRLTLKKQNFWIEAGMIAKISKNFVLQVSVSFSSDCHRFLSLISDRPNKNMNEFVHSDCAIRFIRLHGVWNSSRAMIMYSKFISIAHLVLIVQMQSIFEHFSRP